MSATVRQAYMDRLAEWQAHEAELAHSQRRYRRLRNVLFPIVVVILWLGSGERMFAALLTPPLLFVSWVDWRRTRLGRERWLMARRIAYLESRLAVAAGDWAGAGNSGDRYADDRHPYAADLDLFGRGGLFELLCAAPSRPGQDTLAAWLLAPAPIPEVRSRHGAIDALRSNLELRERLALLGSELAVIDLDGLRTWAGYPVRPIPAAYRTTALIACAVAAVATVGGLFFGMGLGPFVISLLVLVGFGWFVRTRMRDVFDGVEQRALDFAAAADVLAPLAREPLTAEFLRNLQNDFQPKSDAAFGRLVWLGRRIRKFPPLAILLWMMSAGIWIERQRAAASTAALRMLDAWGTQEALASLAAYSFENPDDTFPDLVEGGPCLEGDALGHPLLAPDRCVRNDLRLNSELSILFVSGSNMSGKSTMLRTAGINVVLALAGAPVRATRLRLSPLAVGANMRIQDSLQSGKSRFYAEVLRVRQLLELAETQPLLVLLDELFQGTNSHDRRVGAEAVVCTLLASGAVGFVTTHDLSLTEIADRLAPRTANVHFADQFANGEMTFDYLMRPGVVQQSNALAVMRSAGIKV